MKNKLALSLLILIIAIFLNIAAFVCILLYLKSIILSVLLLLSFIYLSARLLVVLSAIFAYKNATINANYDIVCKDTRILSDQQLSEMLVKKGFLMQEKGNLSSEIKFMRKVDHDKGSYITDVFTYTNVPNEEKFLLLDHEMHNASLKSDKKSHIQIVRQKNVVLCIFSLCIDENSVRQFLMRFNCTFSVFFPVVVDTKNAQVYHIEIPMNRLFAKGKALTDLSMFVSSTFYKRM